MVQCLRSKVYGLRSMALTWPSQGQVRPSAKSGPSQGQVYGPLSAKSGPSQSDLALTWPKPNTHHSPKSTRIRRSLHLYTQRCPRVAQACPKSNCEAHLVDHFFWKNKKSKSATESVTVLRRRSSVRQCSNKQFISAGVNFSSNPQPAPNRPNTQPTLGHPRARKKKANQLTDSQGLSQKWLRIRSLKIPNQTGDEILNQIRDQIGHQIGNQIGDRIGNQMGGRGEIGDQEECHTRTTLWSFPGNHALVLWGATLSTPGSTV